VRLPLTLTFEADPDHPREIVAWQADFVSLERAYPEVDYSKGAMTKIEHIQYLGWTAAWRQGITEKPFEEWRLGVEVEPTDVEEAPSDEQPVVAEGESLGEGQGTETVPA
jgi:hypothetical protein